MDKQESNENGDTNSNMSFLGEYLKQKRVDKNYSLEKFSQKTKISIKILKSLESNDYRHLPSAAYIKGFVSSYVKVLGIPKDEAINKMEYTYLNVLGKPFPALDHTKQMTTKTPAEKKPIMNGDGPSPQELIKSGSDLIKNTKSAIPVLILGLVILIFVGGYKLVSSVIEGETPVKEKDLGPKIESSAVLVKDENKIETPEDVIGETESATDEPVEEGTTEVKKVEAKPEVQRTFPPVDFKRVYGSLFETKTDAPENSDTSIFPEAIKDSIVSGQQNVYIRAIDGNTWLSYKIDSKPIESAIINKGNDLFLQGDEIRVFLGNVNVTKIFYNNYLIDTPTKSGVKSLIFPEESNSKYLLPLFPKAKDDILYTAEDYMKRMKLEEEELGKKKLKQ